nr:biogenesis of lysosome-related organelles complex 1 subunit 2 isoform X1 [Nicotiana tomentosiformis]
MSPLSSDLLTPYFVHHQQKGTLRSYLSFSGSEEEYSNSKCNIFCSPIKLLDGELLQKMEQDPLAESLNDLFTNVSMMIRGELQETNNVLGIVEKMNTRVAEEYKGFGDVASGLRIFVEQLKSKSGSFDEYVQQIDTIEQQVTEFEAVISMLDKYVSLLESKVQSVCQIPSS